MTAEAPQAGPPDPTAATTAEVRPGRRRRLWLTPGGISALAAVAALVIGVIGLFLQARAAPVPPADTPSPVGDAPALFVYGSSMPGMSRYGEISEYVTRSARDTTSGLLYDSGLGYPMAKFGSGGEVRGFVLWLDPATADAALAEMTRLESGLFHPIVVRTASGVTAQAYEWIGPTDGYPRIEAWDGSTADFGREAPWDELAVGDCFQPTTEEEVVITMLCAAPHAYEAYHAGPLAADGTSTQAAAAAECEAAFADFIGLTQAESELTTRVYSSPPTAAGEARVLCGVGTPGALQSGTLAQARR